MSFLLFREKHYSWSFWSEASFVLYVDICHVIILICLIIQHWSVCDHCLVLKCIWILLLTFPVEMKKVSGFEQYLFNLILISDFILFVDHFCHCHSVYIVFIDVIDSSLISLMISILFFHVKVLPGALKPESLSLL